MITSLVKFFENQIREVNDANHPPGDHIELATAVLMLEIGLADSSMDQDELAIIKQNLVDVFHLPHEQVDELVNLAQQEVDLSVSLHDFTRLLNERLKRDEKIRIIELLWRVAFADAVLDKYEEYYIRKIADLLYISHKDYIKTKHMIAGR